MKTSENYHKGRENRKQFAKEMNDLRNKQRRRHSFDYYWQRL